MRLQQYRHRAVLTVKQVSSLLRSSYDATAYVNMTLQHVTRAADTFRAIKMHNGKAMYVCRVQVTKLRHSFVA